MVQYLPAFGSGLFNMLGDANQQVWAKALNTLESFRKTIADVRTFTCFLGCLVSVSASTILSSLFLASTVLSSLCPLLFASFDR